MVRNSINFSALFIFLGFSVAALSAPTPITREAVATGFSNCDEWKVLWTPSRQQMEFQFGDHTARNLGGGWTDKECNIAVPIRVPDGYRIAVGYFGLEYDGFIAKGGKGFTTLRYSFRGYLEKGINHAFDDGDVSGVIYHYPVMDWSRCGEDVVFEVRSYISLYSPEFAPSTFAIRNAISTLRDPAQVTSMLQLEAC